MKNRGVAPDDRDIDDIGSAEQCNTCGWQPAALVLVDGDWQCYNCGEDPHKEEPLITDGGSQRRDPSENPRCCSRCGVYIGDFDKEFCDPCAREYGQKPPIRRCMSCGCSAPEDHMEAIDVSPPDEYYPEFEFICPQCSSADDE